MIKDIFIKIFIIIIAISSAYVFYNYIVEPNVLYPLCLVNSKSCVKIEYYKINNAVLVNMLPTGYWMLYDGFRYVYTYGHNSGNSCVNNKDFEAAYVTDVKKNFKKIDGYKCIENLPTMLEYFQKNSDKNYLYYRSPDINNFDIYALINYLNMKKIIN
jgi:hypothetical protein